MEVVATSGVCARRSRDDLDFQRRNAGLINENWVRWGTNTRSCTPKYALVIMTPEVGKPRFLRATAGDVSRREEMKTKKASHKWLAFNDFSSGGRIRTSDLRVMSGFEAGLITR